MKAFKLAIAVLFASSSFTSFSLADQTSCTSTPDSSFAAVNSLVSDVSKSLIVGKYANKVFRQTCRLEWSESTPATKSAPASRYKNTCSSTLIGATRLLTAAHCNILPGTVATCSCGIDPTTKKEVFTQTAVRPQSSANQNYKVTDVGSDIRVAHLEKAPPCPKPLTPIEPARFPKSLDHAKRLLNDRNCYLAGFGLDNNRKGGSYHSAATPLFFSLNDDKTPQWISYYNTKKIEVTKNALKKTPSAEAAEYIAGIKSLIRDDENASSGTDEGDSGGSLYCIDSDGSEYLVGMPVTADQSSLLVNHPAIWDWLKKHP